MMQSVAVLSRTGRKLMPTNAYRARKLLKSGRAGIECYKPMFTIRLADREEGDVQPVEYACDTGYQHVGVSVKSEKHEYVHNQYDMLKDETERHNDCCKYRRARRNRKRYRKPRFDSRSKKNKEMAPSLRHRIMYQRLVKAHPEIDIHIQYGTKTCLTRRLTRQERHIAKTHANDAYCIGQFHPKHRTRGQIFQKQRRNNRVLAKFYDAKYIDMRDGSKKSGSQLSCGRTKRRESRRTDKNERIYRGIKCQAGSLHTRKQRYDIQAGDVVIFHDRIRVVKGTQC